MKTSVQEALLKKYGKHNPPQLKAGDTVRIHQKIKEGEKERIQVFEGLVISLKHGNGLDGSYTVRKIAVGGIGVERTFPLHSPNVIKVERTKSAKVSRGKLYYMRSRLGKSARFKVEDPNAAVWDGTGAPEEIQEEVVDAVIEPEEVIEDTAVGAPEAAEEAVEAPGEDTVEEAAEQAVEEPATEEPIQDTAEDTEK